MIRCAFASLTRWVDVPACGRARRVMTSVPAVRRAMDLCGGLQEKSTTGCAKASARVVGMGRRYRALRGCAGGRGWCGAIAR